MFVAAAETQIGQDGSEDMDAGLDRQGLVIHI